MLGWYDHFTQDLSNVTRTHDISHILNLSSRSNLVSRAILILNSDTKGRFLMLITVHPIIIAMLKWSYPFLQDLIDITGTH